MVMLCNSSGMRPCNTILVQSPVAVTEDISDEDRERRKPMMVLIYRLIQEERRALSVRLLKVSQVYGGVVVVLRER